MKVRTLLEAPDRAGAGSALDVAMGVMSSRLLCSSNVIPDGSAMASLNVATTVSESGRDIEESVGGVVSPCATVPSVAVTVVVASWFETSSRRWLGPAPSAIMPPGRVYVTVGVVVPASACVSVISVALVAGVA